MTQQKTIFYEEKKVFCLTHGAGHVHQVDAGSKYGVRVVFDIGDIDYFTHDGRLYSYGLMPTLYPYEQYLEISHLIESIPAPRPEKWIPKKGEIIFVTNSVWSMPNLRKFESMSTDGKYRCKLGENRGKSDWEYAFPFKGELPTYMNEEKEKGV
jgi:hypothetical protein